MISFTKITTKYGKPLSYIVEAGFFEMSIHFGRSPEQAFYYLKKLITMLNLQDVEYVFLLVIGLTVTPQSMNWSSLHTVLQIFISYILHFLAASYQHLLGATGLRIFLTEETTKKSMSLILVLLLGV